MKLWQKFIPGVSDKIKTDSIWNVLGYGISGITSFAILLTISIVYDTEILGLFNLIYAIYILLSQLAGAGIHFSVLKHTAQHVQSKEKITVILNSGLVITVLVSTLVIVAAYFSRNIFTVFFEHPAGVKSLVFVLPGLLFFNLNKVLLAFHNACRRMRLYAVLYTLRAVYAALALMVLLVLKSQGQFVTAIFSISESLLFFTIVVYTKRYFSFSSPKEMGTWMKKHFLFGLKSVVGSVFIDINTRVDVLVLGVFTTDKWVGIYSFAAVIIDGFNQLPLVFGRILNPVITGYHYNKGAEALREMVRKARNFFYICLSPIGLLAIIAFPLIIRILRMNPLYNEGWGVFVVLMAGAITAIGYAPFLMTLNQTGFPSTQSALYVMLFATNFILNLVLVPLFGIFGAAVATSVSYASLVIYLKCLVKKKLRIKI
jgi:O-antigen/teichoic acid export membrane protein